MAAKTGLDILPGFRDKLKVHDDHHNSSILTNFDDFLYETSGANIQKHILLEKLRVSYYHAYLLFNQF